jgi:hypothetical protein
MMLTPEIVPDIDLVDIDPDLAKYAIDQALVRADRVTWFIAALAVTIIFKLAANPLCHVITTTSLALERIIKAWRRSPA